MRIAFVFPGQGSQSVGMLSGFAEASSTTAPAPSPKSTHVARSFMSITRDIVSAPMTSAR